MDEPGERLASAASLACHDLRTPLATIAGFAKTMIRSGELPEREQRFLSMIDQAASQIGALVDQLGLAARIRSGRFEPELGQADTLELASASADGRISAEGTGATIETDAELIGRSLEALALAALRHGELGTVGWAVAGRELTLGPLPTGTAPVLDGSVPRDLGALVAGMAIERLGGTLAVVGEMLRVTL